MLKNGDKVKIISVKNDYDKCHIGKVGIIVDVDEELCHCIESQGYHVHATRVEKVSQRGRPKGSRNNSPKILGMKAFDCKGEIFWSELKPSGERLENILMKYKLGEITLEQAVEELNG